ncbi:MAG: NAD(P)/FAD-dependent oxidoreductase [Chloroflexi bacterium]|nr:NAD(P)/FAD-dependent oxidoreductase [Chloroflexota bacterium]
MTQDKYDVVVIGGGGGGMTAAALLSHAGYKTILVEKLPFLGGRASSYEHKGYIIPTGVFLVLDSGELGEVFKEVGAELRVTTATPQRVRIRGKDFQPPEKGQLKAVLAAAARDQAEADRVWKAIKRGLSWQPPSAEITFTEWLRQYTDNESILGIWRGLWANVVGGLPEEIPARAWFDLVHNMGPAGSEGGYPAGGHIAVWESLAKTVRAKGGTIWTRAPAQRIIVEDGVATGVVVRKDRQDISIDARVVISSALPNITIRLAGENTFDKGYLKEVSGQIRVPFFTIIVGSNRPLYPYAAGLMLGEMPRLSMLTVPTEVYPDYAPPGKHATWFLSAKCSPRHPYDKKAELDMLLRDIKEAFPEYDKAGAEVITAQFFDGDWPGFGAAVGMEIECRSPIENLYNVGDAVTDPAGCVPGLSGAVHTARLVIQDIKRRFRPGEM